MVIFDTVKELFMNTVNFPLTDTLVSGQLYIWTLLQIPLFTSPTSQTVYAYKAHHKLSLYPQLTEGKYKYLLLPL